MTRRPDVPCILCGQLLWRNNHSPKPLDQYICRPCRKAHGVPIGVLSSEVLERIAALPRAPQPEPVSVRVVVEIRCPDCSRITSRRQI